MQSLLKDWTAIIPIREGSKGLANKNTKILAGQPLYQHTIDQALDAGASRIVISTDIAQVLQAKHHRRVTVVERPVELCTDDTPMQPVLAHGLSATDTQGVFALLQATSPLRNSIHIQRALLQYASGSHDLVLSVVEADSSILKWGFLNGNDFKAVADIKYCFSNRQSLPPIYRPNGAVYITDSQWFLHNQGFETENIGVITMGLQESIDIDNQANFDACEAIMTHSRRLAA